MNNFVFYSPTEFVFGKDTEIQTGTLAKKYNARKAMIVYGGGSIIRSGLLQRIEDSLQQAGVDYVKLGGVQPNPCLLYTSPSPRDRQKSRMPSSA